MCIGIRVFQLYLSFNKSLWSCSCFRDAMNASKAILVWNLVFCPSHIQSSQSFSPSSYVKTPHVGSCSGVKICPFVHFGQRPYGCKYKVTWNKHPFCLYYNTLDLQQHNSEIYSCMHRLGKIRESCITERRLAMKWSVNKLANSKKSIWL